MFSGRGGNDDNSSPSEPHSFTIMLDVLTEFETHLKNDFISPGFSEEMTIILSVIIAVR